MDARAPAPLDEKPVLTFRPLASLAVTKPALVIFSGSLLVAHRSAWLTRIVAIGLCAGMVLSMNLWLSSGAYPRIPVWNVMPPIVFPLDHLLVGGLFVLLGTLIVRPEWSTLSYLVGILLATLMLWDQSRLSPWAYLYTCLLIVLAHGAVTHRREAGLHACRVIIAATYVWAGLHKLNVTFVHDVFPWILAPFVHVPRDAVVVYPLGLAAATLEILIGVGLLTRRYRHLAVAGAVGMHALVLLSIGPAGHAYGAVIWPWNIAMAATVLILFAGIGDIGVRDIFLVRSFPAHGIACALFGVMPALSFLGAWDTQLSAAFYSGKIRTGIAVLAPKAVGTLPDDIRRHVEREGDVYRIDIVAWSVRERNVLPHYELRIYRAVGRELCRYSVDDAGVTLVVHDAPHWRSGRRPVTRETCATLRS